MIEIIRDKLNEYQPGNQLEEENALKEILQDIALYGLWRSGFFDVGAFQGGTSLRILHGMNRFSEDLDFILKKPDSAFSWSKYAPKVTACFEEFGLEVELRDKARMDQRIRKAMIKDTSLGRQLNLTFIDSNPNRQKKQKIKLEIDTNPPQGSGFAYSYLDFPLDFEVCHQDLSSNFALKIHALLCRPFLKGRDWYDFNWYIKKGVSPNMAHLEAALLQWGPWAGKTIEMNLKWLQETLQNKVREIDWKKATADVVHFITPEEQHSLTLWSRNFFLSKIEQLGQFGYQD